MVIQVMYGLVRRPLHLQDGKQLQQVNALRREEPVKAGLLKENEAKVHYFFCSFALGSVAWCRFDVYSSSLLFALHGAQ